MAKITMKSQKALVVREMANGCEHAFQIFTCCVLSHRFQEGVRGPVRTLYKQLYDEGSGEDFSLLQQVIDAARETNCSQSSHRSLMLHFFAWWLETEGEGLESLRGKIDTGTSRLAFPDLIAEDLPFGV